MSDLERTKRRTTSPSREGSSLTLGHIGGGGGNHSFLEIAIVLKAAGLDIDPNSDNGVEKLIGETLFAQLKGAHQNAFKRRPRNGGCCACRRAAQAVRSAHLVT